jgi:hypothetical protein
MSRAPQRWPENLRWAIAESLDLWFRHVAAIGRGDVRRAVGYHSGANCYSRATLSGYVAETDRRRADAERQQAYEKRTQR